MKVKDRLGECLGVKEAKESEQLNAQPDLGLPGRGPKGTEDSTHKPRKRTD